MPRPVGLVASSHWLTHVAAVAAAVAVTAAAAAVVVPGVVAGLVAVAVLRLFGVHRG